MHKDSSLLPLLSNALCNITNDYICRLLFGCSIYYYTCWVYVCLIDACKLARMFGSHYQSALDRQNWSWQLLIALYSRWLRFILSNLICLRVRCLTSHWLCHLPDSSHKRTAFLFGITSVQHQVVKHAFVHLVILETASLPLSSPRTFEHWLTICIYR